MKPECYDAQVHILGRLTPATTMGISVSVATGLYGVSFGALSVAAGLSLWQTMALSALMFTGGSQYAFIGVIASAGGVGHLANVAGTGMSALGAASLLGVRNGIYGIQNNARLRLHGWRKLLAAHVTIDESTAVASAQLDTSEIKRGFWVAGIGVWLLWNLFTLIGALLGAAMGDPAAWGLDGAAVAAFCGLLWPRLRSGDAVALAVLCGALTLIAVPTVPAGVPILIAALVAAVVGMAQMKIRPQAKRA
ncbi:MAG: AzlC family ABC transporter permease [Actinomycetaceae bacterium]|nr:AzlC family ABC transporter permease [Actinomycetaceae bacterium]